MKTRKIVSLIFVLFMALGAIHLYSSAPSIIIDGKRVFDRDLWVSSGYQTMVVNPGEEFSIAVGLHESATPDQIPGILQYEGNQKHVMQGANEKVLYNFRAQQVGSGVVEIRKTRYPVQVLDRDIIPEYISLSDLLGFKVFSRDDYVHDGYKPFIVAPGEKFGIAVGLHESATPDAIPDILDYQGNIKGMTTNNRLEPGFYVQADDHLILINDPGYTHLTGDEIVVYYFQAKKVGFGKIGIRKTYYPVYVVDTDEQ